VELSSTYVWNHGVKKMKKTSNPLYSLQNKALISLAGSYLLMGCGGVHLTDTRSNQPAKEKTPGEMSVLKDSASMELTIPKPPSAEADSLDFSLALKMGDALRLVHSARYSPKQASIKIDNLAPGTYRINLKLWDSRTQTIFAVGGAETQLQKGQASKAQIVMTSVPSETGSLEISVVYPDKSPVACTSEARLPSCVKSGSGYKVQHFSKNSQCEWEPKNVEIVDPKFCKGLPGAEAIPTVP
jgi:hypothetical protein